MKIVPLDAATKAACKATDKKLMREGGLPWWRIAHDRLPVAGVEAIATSGGPIKPNTKCLIIGGYDGTRFIGENLTETTVTDFVVVVVGTGWQPLVQLGRDITLVN